MTFEITNPDYMDKPLGQYSHIARVSEGKLLYISGQLSNDADGSIIGLGNFTAQVDQSFKNLEAILKGEGLGWSRVFQFRTYVTDARFIPELHQWRKDNYPRIFGSNPYPTNTLLIVSGLVRPEFLFEVEAIAAYR